jgi:hypothetical protein
MQVNTHAPARSCSITTSTLPFCKILCFLAKLQPIRLPAEFTQSQIILLDYRVRARNARSRATPDNHPAALYKLEAVEPHTVAIIAR